MPEKTKKRKLSNCKYFYGDGCTRVHTAIEFAVAKDELVMSAIKAEGFREMLKESSPRLVLGGDSGFVIASGDVFSFACFCHAC